MNKQSNKYKCLLLLILLTIVSESKLQVVNFQKLSPQLQDPDLKDIPYSVANFGFAPFGKTMIGKLVQSNRFSTECVTTEQQEQLEEDYYQNSFLMIPRGQCMFVNKAIHAQELGARMAIITDNAEHERTVVMKDSGYGYKVTIPSIFINYNHGLKLKKLAETANIEVVLKISFDNIKADKANVTFYLQASNRMAYYLVENFKQYYQKINKYINFDIVYDMITCGVCAEKDCYNDKKYCSVHYQHGSSANGRMVLDQAVRQTLMFEKHNKQWWGYMKCIDDECNAISQLEACSNKCVKKTGVKTLKEQFDSSFQNEINPYLEQDTKMLLYAGVDNYPSVSINNIKMKGSLQAQFIFDDICNSLNNPPSSCSYYTKQTVDNLYQSRTYWFIIVLVVILSGLVFTALFVVFKRFMKKRMTNNMQGRVDDMVGKYVEFYSERNNK